MNSVHFSSATPEWSTPQKFFDALNEEFHFTLDVCATAETSSGSKNSAPFPSVVAVYRGVK